MTPKAAKAVAGFSKAATSRPSRSAKPPTIRRSRSIRSRFISRKSPLRPSRTMLPGNPLPPRSVDYDLQKGTGTAVDFGGAVFAPGTEPQQLLDLSTGQIAIHNV